MKFLGIVFLCLSLFLPILTAHAEASITFSDSITTMGNPIPSIIFWRYHTVHAEQGAVLTLTLDASGSCNCRIGGGYILANNTLVGPFSLVSQPTHGSATFAHQFVFQYPVTQTGDVLLRIELYAGYLGPAGLPETITMNYTLTVSGISSSTSQPEQLVGVQRVGSNRSLPVVIYVPTPAAYQTGDLFIDIWQLDEEGIGQPALRISADDLLALPDFPTENILIARDGLISVYKLTTGEYQVNIGPLYDGKVHVLVFDGIPMTHSYEYTFS